jgi:hypothetical protein
MSGKVRGKKAMPVSPKNELPISRQAKHNFGKWKKEQQKPLN